MTFKNYPVTVGSMRIPLHHSAVVSVDKNGRTRYYEYGRYPDAATGKPSDRGFVRRRTVPDLVMGKDGKPTQASLDNLYSYMSKNYGHGTEVEATYDAEADADKVNAFAEQRMNDPKRKKYSLVRNNCTTFANEAVEAGHEKDK